MDYSAVLEELTGYPAVAGHEKELSEYLRTIFEKYCDSVQVDGFYNLIGLKRGEGQEKRKLMISAHLDEIGLMVKSIDDRGFIKLAAVGGIDPRILLAQEVVVHGKRDLPGVIGAKPPHLLKPEETKHAVKLENLSVDIGLCREKTVQLVSVGDIVTLRHSYSTLQNGKSSSKSVDNRCGVVTLLGIMTQLMKVRHGWDIYFIASTQEEFRLAGITAGAYNINPDAAIVIDACHGDMPDASKEGTFSLGKGPAVGLGPNLHKMLTRRMMETAKEEGLSFQTEVMPGDSGTEAWAVQISRSGIPTVLVSIPVRYMHTPVETVSINDIKSTVRLVTKFISNLDKDEDCGVVLC